MLEPYQWYSLLSIVTSSLALAMALLVLRRFPGRRAAMTFVAAMAFFLLAALFGYGIKYGFNEEGGELVMWSTRLFYFFHMLAVGYTAAFVGVYFYGFRVFRRRSAGTVLNFFLGAAAVGVAALVTEIPTRPGLPSTANARLALATISTVYGLMMLGTVGRTLWKNRDVIVRRQALVMLGGILVHGATAEAYAYLRFQNQFPPPLLTASALVMAASFAVAILRFSMFDVTPRPEEGVPYPRRFPLRSGRSYLALERRPDLAFRAFAEAVRRGDVGLLVSRLPPATVREDFDLVSTPILSLSTAAGKNIVPPTHPEMLERLVAEFVRAQGKPIVALEGVEYLATYVGFEPVLRTLNRLRDLVTASQGILVVTVDGGALDERDQALLERDFEPLPVEPHDGFVVQDVFVIHSSGLLVTHAGRSKAVRTEEPDQDLMAGMLTAIMNFARVSFAHDSHELKGFDLGEKQVLIERGDKVILAVVFMGRPPVSIADEMKAFLSRAERKYGTILDRWNGSLDEVVGIRAMTARLLI